MGDLDIGGRPMGGCRGKGRTTKEGNMRQRKTMERKEKKKILLGRTGSPCL